MEAWPPVSRATDCGVNVSYSVRQNWRKSPSKMMSASRIWPVRGFTRDGPIAKLMPAVIQRKVL